MKNIFFAFILLSYSVLAQVGINNPLPDTSTVLDLSGPNNNGRGLLIPTTIDLINDVPNTSNGLLIRDSTLNEIYIRFETDNKWQAVNPWRQEYSSTSIYTLGKKVGIGVQNPTYVLEVLGDVKLTDSLIVNNVKATGTITAGKFIGDGVVPRGAIMMWSGETPPTGWVICDGNGYNSDGSIYTSPQLITNYKPYIQTPDLTGRFVTGYDPNNTQYDTPGNLSTSAPFTPTTLLLSFPPPTILPPTLKHPKSGGVDSVQLTISNLPSHRHSISDDGNHVHSAGNPGNGIIHSDGSGAEIREYSTGQDRVNYTASPTTNSAGIHNHGGYTGYQGSNQHHENRPPYYVLAYIMKL